jgi:hypothetical protein
MASTCLQEELFLEKLGLVATQPADFPVLSIAETESVVKKAVSEGLVPFVIPGKEVPPSGYSRISLYTGKPGKFSGRMWIGFIDPETNMRLNLEVEAYPEEIAKYSETKDMAT